MISEAQKREALDRIRENIAQSGHHVYLVVGGKMPRFVYTIGVNESIDVELILAGALFYVNAQATAIVDEIARQLKVQRDQSVLDVAGYGRFTLRQVHTSWSTALMLGALDYYQVPDMPAFQIVPDHSHWTIDVPDMSVPWNIVNEPVWRWLREPWTYPVPESSRTATDLAALRGERVTEAMRWEEEEWEIFVGDGPDIPKDELRMVPLGTLIAADKSLDPVVHLSVGEGLLRDPDPDSQWRPWRKRNNGTGS